MNDCEHDLSEREGACADGMCPLCLAAELAQARAERDDEIDAKLKAYGERDVYAGKLAAAEAERDAAQREPTDQQLLAAIAAWFDDDIRTAPPDELDREFMRRMRAAIDAARSA